MEQLGTHAALRRLSSSLASLTSQLHLLLAFTLCRLAGHLHASIVWLIQFSLSLWEGCGGNSVSELLVTLIVQGQLIGLGERTDSPGQAD